MTSTQFEWENPPPEKFGRQKIDWAAIAAAARAQPGTWLCLPDTSTSMGPQIRGGKFAAFRPPAEWEVTVRTHPDNRNRCRLYLRWIGGPT